METLRILWMNWRCIRHPLAGGAEVYTHEVARRLARQGHEIILVTSRPKGLPGQEIIDGYKVIRAGGRFTVYFAAKKIYEELWSSGWKPNLIIDEVNTIPLHDAALCQVADHYAGTPAVLGMLEIRCTSPGPAVWVVAGEKTT